MLSMGKIAPGGVIPVRNATTTQVTDQEMSPIENYMIVAVSRIQKQLAGLARQLQDLTKPVDEYSIVSSYSTGKVILAPVAVMLSRNDRRLLTSVTNGNWNLELMGHGDERF